MDFSLVGPQTTLTGCQREEISLSRICREAESIEALLLALFAACRDLEVSIISAQPGEVGYTDLLLISLSRRPAPEPLTVITLPLEQALAGVPQGLLKPRQSPVVLLNDTGEMAIDEALIEEYYQGFRRQQDPRRGEWLLSPASFLPLILNCVCNQGVVTINREITEFRGRCFFALRLKLLFQENERGWEDVLNVVQQKLKKLVEKRGIKVARSAKSDFVASELTDDLLQ